MALLQFKEKRAGSWKKFQEALSSSKWRTTARRRVGTATKRAALYVQKIARAKITAGNVYTENAPLTEEIKEGKTKPLVDQDVSIWQGITTHFEIWDKAWIGIKRTDDAYDLATLLHDGCDECIRVTDKMRRMFEILHRCSIGREDPEALTGRAKELWDRMPGGWLPLSEDTEYIVIPERPFIAEVFEDRKMKLKIIRMWQMAVSQTIRDMAK